MDFVSLWPKFWEVFYTQGAWKRVLSVGLVNTLKIALIGLAIGIVIGTIIASIKVMPKYKAFPRVMEKFCDLYVNLFRGTPIVVQLLLAYFIIAPGFVTPFILQPFFGIKAADELTVCIIVFGLNSGAYVAEIMRAGILAVDPGQMEAGRALGMSYFATMMKIVVPQAIKHILPTLGNELIALVKDTSVVGFVAGVDLNKTFTEIGNVHYKFEIPYLAMAVVYIAMVAIISLGIKIMERWLRKSDRRN